MFPKTECKQAIKIFLLKKKSIFNETNSFIETNLAHTNGLCNSMTGVVLNINNLTSSDLLTICNLCEKKFIKFIIKSENSNLLKEKYKICYFSLENLKEIIGDVADF
jgi:hypothetical protein